MTRSPGTAKQQPPQQPTDLRQTAQTALGRLLLLKTGIARSDDGKPIEVKLDAPSLAVIQSVVLDLGSLIKGLAEQSQSQAQEEAKPKQKQKPSVLARNEKPFLAKKQRSRQKQK